MNLSWSGSRVNVNEDVQPDEPDSENGLLGKGGGSGVSVVDSDRPGDDEAEPMKASSVSSSMAKIMAGNIGMMGLSVLTGIVTARNLETAGRGELAAIMSVVLFMALAGSLGNWTGLARVEATDPSRSDEVVGAAALGVGVLGIVSIGLVELLLPLLFTEQSDELLSTARVLVIFIIPVMMFESANDLFVGRQRFGRVSFDRFIRPFIHAIGLFTLLLTETITVRNVFLVIGTSYLLVGAAGYFSLIAESGIAWPARDLVNKAFKFGTKVFGGILSQKSNHELDLMIMPALVGPEVIGIYVVAVSAAAIVSGGFSHLRQLVFGLVSRDEAGDSTSVIEFTGRIALLGSSVVAVMLYVLAPFLVDLIYGSKFAGSVVVLRILLPGVVALVFAEVMFGALASLDRPLWATWSSLIGLVVTVTGIAILVKPFGARGAAATTTVAYFTMMVAALSYASRLGISIRRLLSPSLLRQDLAEVIGSLNQRRSSRAGVEPS